MVDTTSKTTVARTTWAIITIVPYDFVVLTVRWKSTATGPTVVVPSTNGDHVVPAAERHDDSDSNTEQAI